MMKVYLFIILFLLTMVSVSYSVNATIYGYKQLTSFNIDAKQVYALEDGNTYLILNTPINYTYMNNTYIVSVKGGGYGNYNNTLFIGENDVRFQLCTHTTTYPSTNRVLPTQYDTDSKYFYYDTDTNKFILYEIMIQGGRTISYALVFNLTGDTPEYCFQPIKLQNYSSILHSVRGSLDWNGLTSVYTIGDIQYSIRYFTETGTNSAVTWTSYDEIPNPSFYSFDKNKKLYEKRNATYGLMTGWNSGNMVRGYNDENGLFYYISESGYIYKGHTSGNAFVYDSASTGFCNISRLNNVSHPNYISITDMTCNKILGTNTINNCYFSGYETGTSSSYILRVINNSVCELYNTTTITGATLIKNIAIDITASSDEILNVVDVYGYFYTMDFNSAHSLSVDTVPIEETTASTGIIYSEDYIHNYCVYDVLCTNYNVSADWCEDDPRKWCTLGCADNFNTYYGPITPQDVLEWNITSFSGICINGSYAYVNKTQPGNTYPEMIYNSCHSYYLCLQYNMTKGWSDGCPSLLSNGSQNKFDCTAVYGSIDAVCTDNASYWNSVQIYPSNLDFGGRCELCVSDSECTQEDLLFCGATPTYTYICHNSSTGCIRKQVYQSCQTNYYCASGICIYNTSSTGGGGITSGTDETFEEITGLPLLPKVYQYMIAIIVMMVSIISISYVGYRAGSGQAGFMGGMVLALFWLIFFVFIKWVPVWVLIVLTLLSVALMFFSKMITGQDQGV